MKILDRRLRKLLLFIGVFMLNVAFGGLTVSLLTEHGTGPFKNQKVMPFDGPDIHFKMNAPEILESPTDLRETGSAPHYTVLK